MKALYNQHFSYLFIQSNICLLCVRQCITLVSTAVKIKHGPVTHFSSVQSLSRVRLFATPWITARQASLCITNSQSSLKFMSIESVMPSSHLILCRPLLLPASGSFQMSQLFAWGSQSIGVSALASVFPKNIQDWSLEWTDWILLLYPSSMLDTFHLVGL